MNKQYIKKAIPETISEDGGAIAVFVNKETIPLETSIKEALHGNYTMGQEPLIKNLFMGLMKSMIEGLLRDGHARTLAGLLTIYLVVKGEIDLEKGWNDEVNSLQVRARLLKDLDIDITNWVFQDVTPGKRAFTISTVKAGDVKGVYELGNPGEVNGVDFPNTELGEEIRVDWAVEGTDKSGTLPASKVASDATRIDIAEGAFDELKSSAYDGKTLTLTVRGNFSKASKSATLKFVPPPPPEVAGVQCGENEPGVVWFEDGKLTITGEHLEGVSQVMFEADFNGTTEVCDITENIATKASTQIATGDNGFENTSEKTDLQWTGKSAKLVLVRDGARFEHAVQFKN